MTKPIDIARLPFAFWVEDRQEQSAIYIVDPDKRLEQRLNLYIENTSEQTLFFSATNLDQNPPSADNCHFELRFRRGVLDGASLGTSALKNLLDKTMELLLTGKYQKRAYEIGSWVISEPDDHGEKEPYVSFYLARSEKGSGGRFLPGERFRLVLTNISANPEEGSSETRVELVPRNTFYDPPTQADARLVDEPREQNVLIVNHTGKEHIPLHLAFVGPYTLRNDGQAQGEGHLLRLRITNTSRHDAITFNEKSRLLFAFDFAEGDQEEELGKAGDVGKIEFYLKEKYTQQSDLDWKNLASDPVKIKAYLDKYCTAFSSHSQMAQNPVWELGKDQKLPSLTLEPHQHWDILLDTSDFITHSPAGLTPLHITYEGIPGYWDGKLHTAVEKMPLVVRKGTGIPGHITGETVEMDSGNRTLYLKGNNKDGSANTHARLHVIGRTFIDGAFVSTGETQLRGEVKTSQNLIVDGNVGIGTAPTEERLHVNGNTKVSGLLKVTDKVGIGIDPPEEQLHVVGKTILVGNLNVGGAGLANLITRHIEGKAWNSAEPDNLYLNYYSGKEVHIGQTANPSSLHVTGRIKDKTGELMPVGAIIAYGGKTIPNGWLECTGQTIYKTSYPDLVEALTGNKDATNASVPNLQSRFIVGVGTKYSLGETGGEEKHTLSIAEMPKHRHGFLTSGSKESGHIGTWSDINRSWHFKMTDRIKSVDGVPDIINGLMNIDASGANDINDKRPQSISFTGNNQPHNNLPPYYALRYIIKY